MRPLTRWVVGHRLLVALLWLVVAGVGAAMAPTTVDRLTYDFALPGQPAYETNTRITEAYGTAGIDDPLVLVARTTGGGDPATVVTRAARAAQEALPGTLIVVPGDPGAASLAPEGADLAAAVVYPPVVSGPDSYAAATPRLTALAKAASGGGTTVTLTGFTVLAEGGGDSRGVLFEVLLGGLGALVVLALVFGSLLAGVPLLVAAVSILGTFLALLGLTQVTDVSFVVQYLVALIGLGVAIDYSLLVVTRWREERAAGLSNDQAVLAAMATAGRSVLFSGITVAVSLAALVLVPLPFLRSIGLGGLLIPTLSVATSLTLVPALLSAVGPRLQWPRKKVVSTRSRTWTRIAEGVLRHRWLTVLGTVALLLVLAAPVLGLRLGSPSLTGLASSSEPSQAATAAVDAGVPVGVLRPTLVLSPERPQLDVGSRLRRLDGVAAVAEPAGSAWTRDGQTMLLAWAADDPSSDAGRATLDRIRDAGVGEVGGSPAEDADFVSAVYGDVGWVVLGVALVTFLLLARALRSLWLPVKAVVLNVISIAAAYGVTVFIWQGGHGTDLVFGAQSTGVITTWVPIAAFSFLFGLSMDYEVFILSRMREAYDEHGDTDRAVVDGIANTGRLVTSAALILFLAFVALSTVPSIDVKILATTLALGIVIDAVVVRGLLAPALVAVLGHLNWELPRWLGRLLLVGAPGAPRHRA